MLRHPVTSGGLIEDRFTAKGIPFEQAIYQTMHHQMVASALAAIVASSFIHAPFCTIGKANWPLTLLCLSSTPWSLSLIPSQITAKTRSEIRLTFFSGRFLFSPSGANHRKHTYLFPVSWSKSQKSSHTATFIFTILEQCVKTHYVITVSL